MWEEPEFRLHHFYLEYWELGVLLWKDKKKVSGNKAHIFSKIKEEEQ